MSEFHVKVPASTSNLGPGFDVLGMAVDVFLEVRFQSGPPPFELVREGTLSALEVPPEEDLTVQALSETLLANPQADNELAVSPQGLPGGVLTVSSEIPVGQGLGSSAAALAAGRILGLVLAGLPVVRDEVVSWVAEREGHPDNAAPAVLGGLVAARPGPEGQVRVVPLPLSGALDWVFAAPGVGLSTRVAREALPEAVPHAAAVRNAARVALLLPALAAGDGALITEAMEDEIHVPYRIPLIPGGAEALEAGRRAGALAVTLSGAGSGLLAVCLPGQGEAVGRTMADAFRAVPAAGGGDHRVVRPWSAGALWGEGPPPDDSGRLAAEG